MEVEEWWNSIPIITKTWLTLAFATAVAVTFELVSPLRLYLDFNLAFNRGQWWRLLTTFIFFDKLGVGFFFHAHFLYFYCRRLEEHFYLRRTGDFLFSLLVAAGALMAIAPYFDMMFLSSPMVMVVLYLWARRFPMELLQIYGLVTVTSAYLPYFLTFLTYMMAGYDHALMDVLAICIGHCIWYLADVLPQITGVHLMSPSFFTNLFLGNRNAVQ